MQAIKDSYYRFNKSSRVLPCYFYLVYSIVVLTCLVVNSECYCQEIILAKYKLTTEYNINSTIQKLYSPTPSRYSQFSYTIDLKENKYSINKTDSLLSDTLIKKLVNEEFKMLQCSYGYYYYCSSDKNMLVIDSFDNSQNEFRFNLHSDIKNYILDNVSLLRTPVSKIDNNYKGDIAMFDSTKLLFVETDSFKTFGNWYCQKYILKDSSNTTSIWLTEDIPDYVNPQVFALNVRKAVVQVQYDNGYTLSLMYFHSTDMRIPKIKMKVKTNIRVINPLKLPLSLYSQP